MPLTHDQLREAKLRRSLQDLNLLIEFAEETIGEPPLKINRFDEEGNLVEDEKLEKE